MKKLVLGALCIVLVFAANAAVTTVKIDDLYYYLDDETKTAEVAGSDTTLQKWDVEIPASVTNGVESYAVTSIGANAFAHCSALESVSAPSITSIGALAFSDCTALKSVSAPSVASIEESAFGHCSALTSVYAPSVTSIENGAFVGCPILTSLTVNSAMEADWDSNKGGYGLGALGPGFKVTFYTPPQPIGESTTTWVLTDGVLTIGGTGAMPDLEGVLQPWFDDKQSITTVIIESGVTSIGDEAFSDCTSLKSVSALSVTSIGMSAFSNCPSLKSVYAPFVTSIGKFAFDGCTSLTSLTVNSAMEEGWDSNKGTYGIDGMSVNPDVTFYTPPTVKVEPNPAANSTAKVYANGVEVTSNPIVVLSNATVVVVFTADYGYCFEGYALVQTNAVKAVNDPTVVDGPVTIKNTVTVVPQPHDNSTAKVYTNGVEVTGNPIVVLSNATVAVVFTAEEGFCFAGDHSTIRTNAVQATADPTYVSGPLVVKKPSMSVEVAQQAEWGGALMSGDLAISAADYANACVYYGISPKTAPQVVQEGEIAVTKESLQAAKAETVEIVGGMVYLGVSVLSNSDITASTTSWAPVKFTKDTTIYVTTDGTKLILPIPAPAQQGFMILHSGGAKVGMTSGGGPAANHAVQVAGGLYLDGVAEDQLVEVRGLDTRVLGNTAEKANDDSSDE